MQIRLTLANDRPFVEIPIEYNHLVQSCLYSNISRDYGDFLHETGYRLANNSRKFSMFVFSRIMGESEFLKERKVLRFQNPVQLYISSPMQEFINEIVRIFLKDGIRIGSEILRIDRVDLEEPKVENNCIKVCTLSPVVAYSTFLRTDGTGRKYTAYFHPGQADFERVVIENLRKKGRLIYGEDTVFEPTTIRHIGSCRRHVATYKRSIIIEAHSGKFELKGDIRLLQTALDAGLGGKGSNGFGFIRKLD